MADTLLQDDLNRYWNAVVTGETPLITGIDPAMREALDWAMSQDDAPGPDASFVARLENALTSPRPATNARAVTIVTLNAHQMVPAECLPRTATRPAPMVPARHTNGFRSALDRSAIHGRRFFSYVSLAAVLLLLLGGVWSMFQRNDADKRSMLADHVQISSELDAINTYEGYLQQIVLDPGGYYAATRFGPTIFSVQDGSVNFESLLDRDARLLSPGESISATSGSTFILENKTWSPVTVFVTGLCPTGTLDRGPNIKPGVHIKTFVNWWLPEISSGATLELQRTTVKANGQIAQWQTTGKTWIFVEEGSLALTLSGDRVPPSFEPGIEVSPPPNNPVSLLAGVTVDIRNPEETSLMVFVVTITPSSQPTT